jgi:hypothetical protein
MNAAGTTKAAETAAMTGEAAAPHAASGRRPERSFSPAPRRARVHSPCGRLPGRPSLATTALTALAPPPAAATLTWVPVTANADEWPCLLYSAPSTGAPCDARAHARGMGSTTPGFANRDEHLVSCLQVRFTLHCDQTATPPRTQPLSSPSLDADAALQPGALFFLSQPPIAATNRWKTLAGVTRSRSGVAARGFAARQYSIIPVAAMA